MLSGDGRTLQVGPPVPFGRREHVARRCFPLEVDIIDRRTISLAICAPELLAVPLNESIGRALVVPHHVPHQAGARWSSVHPIAVAAPADGRVDPHLAGAGKPRHEDPDLAL